MTLIDLLSTLRSRDITIWADGERLRYSAASGALTPDIREELVRHKADLLTFLNEANPVRRVTHAPITKIPREAKLLPSINQRRLWFIDQLQPNTAFNCYKAFRIKGCLSIESLEQSLNEIVRRHEVLRTTFPAVDGEPFQVIIPSVELRLSLIDLRDIADVTMRDIEASRIITEEVERPYDLAKGPLFRTHLLCLGTDEHLLLLTMHHIVTDGWSMGLLVKELTVLYEAFCNGNSSPLAELPVQYVDFAHWQSQRLQDEVLQPELAYWKERLKSAPEVIDLPTDRPRPAIQSYQGASEPVVISKSLTAALRTLSKNNGVTLFMTLLAAFKTLLYRYTGQEDLVLGSPIAGRRRVEIENLIGLFINTLVLRTDLSGNPSFRELLRRVQDVALGAYAHQDVPFEKLIEDLHLQRSLSFASLFQVMFVLQNTPESKLTLSDLTVSQVTIDRETALTDLFLSLTETDEGLQGVLSYRTDLFLKPTITRMIGAFQVLLEGIVAEPDQPISTLPVLHENEKQQLLVEWNETTKAYPRDKCLHHLFEEQAERTPQAVAVVFQNQQLTYRELNRRANQLAHYLRKLGVRPDVLVGICVERSLEMIVGLLGILKAGGGYVPLDPHYPEERLAFLLKDARLSVLLTQQRLATNLPTHAERILYLDVQQEAILTESGDNPLGGAMADSLAYVIYTSGSTGQPKGVMIAHSGICNRLFWGQEAYKLIDSDRVLHAFSLSFDFATWEIFTALVAGAQLIIAEPGGHLDSNYLVKLIRDSGITFAGFVPSMLKAILEESEIKSCTSLKRVVSGGEALPVELQECFLGTLKDVELQNTYGPTEASIDVTCWVCGSENGSRSKQERVPIGRPITNTQIYVLDSHLQPVPVGMPGQLYIGGVGLARGYLNRPDFTAASFSPNPFNGGEGARLYRTGDLVRYLPDGNIEFFRRVDDQVKIRGFRIELGEIESVLGRHPSVREVVVQAREDGDASAVLRTGKRLVAYVVASKEQTCTTSDLREFLKQQLPEHMIPSVFVLLDTLPLMSNGKVDRKALPVPDQNSPELEESFVAPRNPVEEMIAEIWAEVLKLGQVGVHDNFFDLGGHSLLATQVMSRVRHVLGVELPLRGLFEAPTVAALAERVEGVRREAQGLVHPPIAPVSRESELPLSFAQERLWFLDRYEPNSSLYNIPSALRLGGGLNIEALERSLNEIICRHESLRTTFSAVEGEPVQLIAPSVGRSLAVVDLRDHPEGEREEEVRRLVHEEARRPFDLAQGPLFRSKLLRLGEDDHVLLLTMHHIVSDGWSMGVLNRELAVLYRSFVKGESSPLVAPPIQYADFAVWQRGWLQGEILDRQLSYWKKRLEGVPGVLKLPTDHPRPAIQSYQGAQISIELSRELSEGLKELSRKQGVTLFMTLLAAFQTLLYRYTGQEDIVVGSPIANRNRTEIEGLIGFFVNTLVLRSNFSGDPTFKELLARVREMVLGDYAHQDLPFEKLVQELKPERTLSYSPLVQVMFVLQHASATGREFEGLSVSPIRIGGETSKFDLSLSMVEGTEGLRGSLRYNTDLFDDATISRMLGHINTLLHEIVADPEQHIDSLRLMDPVEREQLVEKWSTASSANLHNNVVSESAAQRVFTTSHSSRITSGDSQLTFGQIITAWARRTPEAVAVIAPGRAPLTYARLQAHIESVAAQLCAIGIRRNDRVALLLPNGPEMASAFLAVAAGAATSAPLNPGCRAEELDFCLTDLKAKSLIVQSGVESEAKVVAQSRGIPVIELCPQFSAEAGLFALKTGSTRNSLRAEPARPHDIALVLHTSGTTARPKLVPLTHANLVSSARNIGNSLALTPSDRCLNVMPLFHIHGLVGALLSSLAAGASVICAPGFYAPEFFQWLEEFHPTWYTAVPTMHQALLARAQTNLATVGRRPLRFIRSSSAALPRQLMRELEAVFRAPVIETYGMTETAHQIAGNPLPPSSRKEGSVGLAAGTEIRIMDAAGNELPAGATGEVVVRAPTVTSGYENDNTANGSTFIRGWFRTGDQGHLDTEGYLFLSGRFKEIINRGGEKISPREVDELLMSHPAVAQAVTFPVPNPVLGEEVAAAIVLREQAAVSPRELREFAARRLADFKVPRQLVIVDTIPQGPTGKFQRIDLAEKLGLSALDQTRTAEPNIFETPKTPLESRLAEIWIQVLKVKEVGRQDNFFQLGGDSVLAVQVIARVRTQLEVEISLLAFFETPTVAGLARSVEIARESRQAFRPLPLRRSAGVTAFPLSYAQHALWFLDRLEPGNLANNRPVAFRLIGVLDIPALEKSIDAIVNRHEALRTIYPIVDESPMQVIAPAQPFSLQILDLRASPVTERDARARELAIEEARRPFDLAEGPMLRAILLKLSEEEHVLVVIMHHIASDGWSSEVFFRELAISYNAFAMGTVPDLPPLSVQYADFTMWQRKLLQGDYLENLLSYWKQQIGEQLPRLKFPNSGHQRSAFKPRQGEHHVLTLPLKVVEALKTLSKRNNVTLFMTLLTAFKTLLYRYTGQEDFIIGIPAAGRNSEEFEGVIGDFINMLPVRNNLSGNPSFLGALERVRKVTLQAYAHQELPLARLAEALRMERGIDIRAAFQVIFNLRNFPSQTVAFAGLQTRPFDFDYGIARFDLSLEITERSDGLCCLFEHDTALFDKGAILRLMRHFQILLESIVANPDREIEALSLQTETERRPVVVQGSTTQGDKTPSQQSIHRLFEGQAARKPTATAVVYDGNSLSYAGLNRRANQLAHYLRGMGIGPDTLVGICVERSLEMAVGVMGILKAGAAYVPLDPRYPKERLAFMLRDSAVSVVLTQQRLLSSLPPHNARIVALDADWSAIAKENEENPDNPITAAHLAYVIYTSGSTGQPKGVLVTQGGVVNHSVAVAELFALCPEDRVSQCNSISFDISVEELFSSWISGAAVILCPSEKFLPDGEFAAWLAEEEITVLNLPTAFWHEWVYALERRQKSLSDVLRLVVVGGESAALNVLAKWQTVAPPHVHWLNTYGPTEATVTTTVYDQASRPLTEGELSEIPIGRPIAGAQVYVLNRNLDPVPIGVAGELHISGAGLARGYLNRAEQTSESFIPNPFSNEAGARLYKTGDLCRYLPDGNIEFLARNDHQVKIRGFRVEMGEIESVLGQHPGVREAVVLARENNPGDPSGSLNPSKRLAAYVVLAKEKACTTSELRNFLKQKLPEYMVPVDFVLLDSLPLTPNGKLDRKRLPAPEGIRPDSIESFVAPRTPIEEALVAIWAKLLGINQVGIRDNFFELGGHSLLAVRLFSEIEKAFNKRPPLASLFQEATIESLAHLISQETQPTMPSSLIAIQPQGSKLPFFCVHEFFGDVFCYVNLARRLGNDQPFYALEPRGLDGSDEPFTDVESMAAYYTDIIRTIQPHGPYALGGLCFGGVIAFEMAQQLRAKGEPVALVALLDSGIGLDYGRLEWWWRFFQNIPWDFRSWLTGSLQLTRGQWLDVVRIKSAAAKGWLANLFHPSTSAGQQNGVSERLKRLGEVFQFSERHQRIARAQYRALKNYQVRRYTGRLTLFRARMQPFFSSHDPHKGWSRIGVGGVEVRNIPGNHLGMLQEPHVEVLARELGACLERAREG